MHTITKVTLTHAPCAKVGDLYIHEDGSVIRITEATRRDVVAKEVGLSWEKTCVITSTDLLTNYTGPLD